jgi:hypothetical protein
MVTDMKASSTPLCSSSRRRPTANWRGWSSTSGRRTASCGASCRSRVEVTPRERQSLLKYRKKLGGKIRALITIVTPRTFLRWVQGDSPKKRRPSLPGRPRTDEDIRALVLRLARENDWGYTRILGS